MTNSQLKGRALQVLAKLPGRYLIFVPALLASFAQTGVSIHGLSLLDKGYLIEQSATFFPDFLSILSAATLLSASLSMLEVVRQEKDRLTFDMAFRIFHQWYWLRYLILGLIRYLLLLPSQILMTLGFILLIPNLITETVELLILGLACLILGLVLNVRQAYRYRMADYILFDQLETGTFQSTMAVVKASRQLMKGQKGRLFLLDFSFIGWYLLAIPTFGLLYIYILPYQTTTEACFYQDLLEKKAE